MKPIGSIPGNEPLSFAVNIVFDGSTISGIVDGEKITIQAPRALLKKVVALVESSSSADDLLNSLSRNFDRTCVGEFLEGLLESALVVPKRNLLPSNWALIRNPQNPPLPVDQSIAESLAEHARNDVDQLPDDCRILPADNRDFSTLLQKRSPAETRPAAAMTVEDLSSLLYAAYGVLDKKKHHAGEAHWQRTIPSAGAIYPLTLTWCQWRQLGSLEAGVYRVHFSGGRKVGLRKINDNQCTLFRSLIDPIGARSSPGAVIISCDLPRPCSKYGGRGVSYALIEAGQAAQNMNIAALEAGIPVREIGGFCEAFVKDMVESDLPEPVLVILLGGDTAAGKSPDASSPQLEFSWIDYSRQSFVPPFHVGTARIRHRGRTTDWCWGKSADASIAYDKAAAEAVERLACESPADLVHESADKLEQPYIEPSRLVRYSTRQYARKDFPFKAFDAREKHLWTTVKRLGDHHIFYVPAETCYFANALHPHPEKLYTSTSTSGAAAHPTAAGALERAILELIERHFFMLAWYSALSCRKIDPQSIPLHLQTRLHEIHTLGWNPVVLLLAEEPVTTVAIFCQSERMGATRVSASSAYALEQAIVHSLEEMEAMLAGAQRRAGATISAREVRTPGDHARLYEQRRHFRKADHLIDVERSVAFDDCVSACRDFQALAAWLSRNGITVYYKDISPPVDIALLNSEKLYVFRALAERLLPIAFGYGLEPMLAPEVYGVSCPGKWPGFPHPFS